MIKRTLTFLALLTALNTYAQTKSIQAIIDAGKAGAPISKRIYGQFIEHIAGIINTGIWAEMLEDRKFYNPITSQAPPAPGQERRGPVRRWTPVGPDAYVSMDSKRPYAGDHAPIVILHRSERRGFQQTGLAVRKGKLYTGRIVLAGDPGAKISVSLIWGADPHERQSISMGKPRPAHSTFPLKFQAQADSNDARLEITGTGTGTFHVGAVSLMPADNMQGFRPEIITALKQLHSGVYRFPGGNFVSAFEWRNAVGDPDKRPPIMDPVWNAVQPNDVGIDEFMTLCRLLKVVPDYLGQWDWSGGLLSNCLDNIDMLSEHYYAYSNQRFDFDKGERVPDPDQTLVEWARQPANYVRAKYEHYQEYLARIPALKNKPVPISISEWAYTGVPANSYKVVLPYAFAFHEMFRHSELFKMATFTFATSLLSTGPNEAVLNPSGLLFKLYRDHFGTIPVAVTGNSPQPAPRYPARGSQPKVNPGSDTYPLDVAAALSDDRKTLSVAVINLTESAQELNLAFKSLELTGEGKLWLMAPKSLDAATVAGQKPGVEVEEHAVETTPERTTIAPFSVSIYELAVK